MPKLVIFDSSGIRAIDPSNANISHDGKLNVNSLTIDSIPINKSDFGWNYTELVDASNIPPILDYTTFTRIGNSVEIESGVFLLKFQLSFKEGTEEMPLTMIIKEVDIDKPIYSFNIINERRFRTSLLFPFSISYILVVSPAESPKNIEFGLAFYITDPNYDIEIDQHALIQIIKIG